MFREYTKALFKRVDKRKLMQFKPPTLPQRIYTKTLRIDQTHYEKFCKEVAWLESGRIHPLYLQMVSLPLQMQCLLDKQSPFPLLGLIHSGNRVDVLSDYDISEWFEFRVRFSDVTPHVRGWEVHVLLDVLQHGKLVYRATSRYLVKVKAVHVAPYFTTTQNQAECNIPFKSKIAGVCVASDTGRRYAKLSHDYNPIHLTSLSAKVFGFKTAIAHGMWTLSRAISAFEAHREEENTGAANYIDCQFKKPVSLPSSIDISQRSDNEKNMTVDVTGSKDNALHLTAFIRCGEA